MQAAIERFRKKWSLPRRKSRTAAAVACVGRADEGRRDRPREQRGRRDVAVVALVAHLERLAGQAAQVESARRLAARRDSAGPSDVGEPAQPLQDGGVVGAEAEDLAEALVQGRVGARPRAAFSTTTTGIDGLITPAIGPTAPW